MQFPLVVAVVERCHPYVGLLLLQTLGLLRYEVVPETLRRALTRKYHADARLVVEYLQFVPRLLDFLTTDAKHALQTHCVPSIDAFLRPRRLRSVAIWCDEAVDAYTIYRGKRRFAYVAHAMRLYQAIALGDVDDASVGGDDGEDASDGGDDDDDDIDDDHQYATDDTESNTEDEVDEDGENGENGHSDTRRRQRRTTSTDIDIYALRALYRVATCGNAASVGSARRATSVVWRTLLEPTMCRACSRCTIGGRTTLCAPPPPRRRVPSIDVADCAYVYGDVNLHAFQRCERLFCNYCASVFAAHKYWRFQGPGALLWLARFDNDDDDDDDDDILDRRLRDVAVRFMPFTQCGSVDAQPPFANAARAMGGAQCCGRTGMRESPAGSGASAPSWMTSVMITGSPEWTTIVDALRRDLDARHPATLDAWQARICDDYARDLERARDAGSTSYEQVRRSEFATMKEQAALMWASDDDDDDDDGKQG